MGTLQTLAEDMGRAHRGEPETGAGWVYLRSEPGLWTVGFYKPDGKWESESDHPSREDAAARVHYLNGGSPPPRPTESELVRQAQRESGRSEDTDFE